MIERREHHLRIAIALDDAEAELRDHEHLLAMAAAGDRERGDRAALADALVAIATGVDERRHRRPPVRAHERLRAFTSQRDGAKELVGRIAALGREELAKLRQCGGRRHHLDQSIRERERASQPVDGCFRGVIDELDDIKTVRRGHSGGEDNAVSRPCVANVRCGNVRRSPRSSDLRSRRRRKNPQHRGRESAHRYRTGAGRA